MIRIIQYLPHVTHGRLENGRHPDDVDAQCHKVVEFLDYPAYIPFAVSISVLEALDQHLVDGCLLPPFHFVQAIYLSAVICGVDVVAFCFTVHWH